MSNEIILPAPEHPQIIFYQSNDGTVKLEARFEEETVWLSQKLLAVLFQVSVPTINGHIKTIYKDSELFPDLTVRKFLIVKNSSPSRNWKK